MSTLFLKTYHTNAQPDKSVLIIKFVWLDLEKRKNKMFVSH